MIDQRERELKFDVPDDWELVEPAGLVAPGGSLERDVVRLVSTYYDTAGHDLLDAGLTLRRRTGDADVGWQLKVPDGDARTEIRAELNGRGVPAELRDLTAGVRAGAPLRRIAVLRTDRAIVRLLAADGTGLAEIVTDSVTVDGTPDGGARSWREVEVELLDGDEKLLRRVARWLTDGSAVPAAVGSKLAHAVGAGARRPASRKRVSGLVGRYLDRQYEAILRGDLALRRGDLRGDGDVVHATRVATRRYRSVLRVFRTALDRERAAHLDGELRWYAGVLGELRERQVLRAHLDAALDDLPDELVLGPVRARIDATLDAEQARAREALRKAMRSRRYYDLLGELRAWRAEPPLVSDGPASDVRAYLRRAERTVARRLESGARRTGAEHDDAMHRARKAAKRARYTAELARPALGAHARTRAKAMKAVQTHLGDRQDAVVAAEFLRRIGAVAGTTPGENGFTFGLLVQRELDAMRREDRAVR